MCMELKRILDNRSLPKGVEQQKYGNSGTVAAYEEKPYAPTLESLAEVPHQEGDAASASQEASCKIEVPNRKVGVLIGKADETIRNLQMSSGAKIQVTKDVYTSNALTQSVELVGTRGSVDKDKKLIKNVTAQAEAGGSPALLARGFGNGQSGSEQYQMTVPDNKNLSKHTDKSGGYGPQGYHPQGHAAASQGGPCSDYKLPYQSQPGYGYPPQNYNPSYDYPQHQSPHGGMGWNMMRQGSPHPSYHGGDSDYKLPYKDYPHGPGNFNSYVEPQAPGYGHLYPRYNAPPMNWHYEQPPMDPSQYYPQLPGLYARRYQAAPSDTNYGSAYPQSGNGAGQWRP